MAPTPEQLSAQIRSLQEQLSVATQRVAKLESMRNDIFSRISHELKTPLTTILGFAEVLLEPAQYDTEQIQDFASEIHQQARRLHLIAEDMVNLARMENGLMGYHLAPLNVAALVERVAREYRAECEQQEVELAVEVGAACALSGDQEKLLQVLRSLLRNAMEATPGGGRIALRCEADPAEYRVSVADTGKGIPPDELPDIFAKFTQVEDILHHHQGLGLGLALSRRIIEDGHGGRITAHSAGAGQGATFVVHLPRS